MVICKIRSSRRLETECRRLWDAWKEPKPKAESVHKPDTWLQSFSIITTEANEIMSQVHTRMPVILLQEGLGRMAEQG